MEDINIERDKTNPQLYHLTIDRKTLRVLQAASRAYKSRLEANKNYYHRKRTGEVPTSDSPTPTMKILTKISNLPI